MLRECLPWSAHSVALARRAVASTLSRAGVPEEVVDDVRLVLSELMSNSLRHARPLAEGLRVECGLQDGEVRVAVTDAGGSARPALGTPTHSSQSGRGLRIICDLAREWGIATGHGEQTVWAVLSAHHLASR